MSDAAREALAVFRSISTARQMYGGAAIGLFIISMTQGADDVLTFTLLEGRRAAGRFRQSGSDSS